MVHRLGGNRAWRIGSIGTDWNEQEKKGLIRAIQISSSIRQWVNSSTGNNPDNVASIFQVCWCRVAVSA